MRNRYVVCDARQLASQLSKKDKISSTITSPPYWDLKDYGTSDQIGANQSLEAYLTDLATVFDQVWDATKPSGSLWVVIKSIRKRGRFYPLPFLLAERLTEKSAKAWHLQDVIIWHKPHSLPFVSPGKLQDRFEYVLCFSKSPKLRLNVNQLRNHAGTAKWWVKYPERHNPLGKALGNVWQMEIPNQGRWGKNGWRHYCPLPEELIEQILLLSTKPGDLILDPFAGSGTTLLAAKRHRRAWLGLDLNPDFKKIFADRTRVSSPARTDSKARTTASLTKANLHLRQLKFPLQLYRMLAPSTRMSTRQVPLILVRAGKIQSQASPHWVKGLRVELVVDEAKLNGQRKKIERAIADLCSRSPLSLFQVSHTVRLVPANQVKAHAKRLFGSRPLFLYTQGQFWKSTGPVEEVKVRKRETRLPDIIADIDLSEKPAY